jgi:ribonucleoside-diphosphate reductase alpha chain
VVSKTIHLPPIATVNDVRVIFLAAWRARVNGITIYPYGTKPAQVFTLLSSPEGRQQPPIRVGTALPGGWRSPLEF